MQKAPVMCLCGSTKFKDKFLEWNRIFTLEGYIVLMPGVFSNSGDPVSEEQKMQLDVLHKQKIIQSDVVFIIDQDNYIGDSTREEIGFAKALNLPIFYMSDMEDDSEKQKTETERE